MMLRNSKELCDKGIIRDVEEGDECAICLESFDHLSQIVVIYSNFILLNIDVMWM